jgi:hypothetical protein
MKPPEFTLTQLRALALSLAVEVDPLYTRPSKFAQKLAERIVLIVVDHERHHPSRSALARISAVLYAGPRTQDAALTGTT